MNEPTIIPTEPPELITYAEAGEILGSGYRTIQRLVAQGVLETVERWPGAKPRLRRADVVELVLCGCGKASP